MISARRSLFGSWQLELDYDRPKVRILDLGYFHFSKWLIHFFVTESLYSKTPKQDRHKPNETNLKLKTETDFDLTRQTKTD